MKPVDCAALRGAGLLISQAADIFFRNYFQKEVDEVFISCSLSRPSAEGNTPIQRMYILVSECVEFWAEWPGFFEN